MGEPFGPWVLDSLIAVGGLGEVWEGRRDDGAVAAVKRLHTHLARNEDARAQFAIEQQLALALPRHPCVVHGIETGTVDGRPYVALDRLPGADLRRTLVPPGPPGQQGMELLPRRRALAIARAACDGAAHVHRFGWIHGDINPGNLIVDGDRAVLIDLGVARRAGEAGVVRGTHAYMAPEQVRGGAWTPATDVFALGVVLWELVQGERLFHRGPPWLTMAAVVEAEVPPLPDPELDAIARAALCKDPARRLPTAAELGRLLAARGA